MSDYRGMHFEAAGSAINAIGELQELFAAATDKCEQVIGAILEATGSTETESASNAMNAIQGVRQQIDELFGMTNLAVEEMRRYQGGF